MGDRFGDRLGRWLAFRLEPELAHRLAIKALKSGWLPAYSADSDRRLGVTAAGLRFPNPIGVAAGLDKNAEVPDALLRIGFGFSEAGTITPRPQQGNPQPPHFPVGARSGADQPPGLQQ